MAAILISALWPHALVVRAQEMVAHGVEKIEERTETDTAGNTTKSQATTEESELESREPTPQEKLIQDATRELLPMNPEQIEVFRSLFEDTRSAAIKPLVPDPKPVSRSIDLTQKPGEATPVIRMAGGNVATLTFSDVTGQPWPVLSVTTGNPTAFSVGTAGVQGESNIIVISPLTEIATSNLVVTLVDHPVPVVLTVKSGEQTIDYRVDFRISKRGPMSSYDIVNAQSLPPTGDSVMLAFLDGVPPEGARKLRSSRSDVEGYLYDDMLYIRTELDLLSPAYLAKSTNVSDLNVYTLMNTPVLILSKDGRMFSVSLE